MLFKIEYEDSETGEPLSVEVYFDDTPEGSAYEWAEDYAYALSSKSIRYTITEILR